MGLLAAYESLRGRTNISYDEFVEQVNGWNVEPVLVGGEVVGAILVNGPEIHACIKPEGFRRWFRKQQMHILDSTIEKHGYAMTRVMQGNEIGKRFVERLGFTESHIEGNAVIYTKVKQWE